jgi:transposase-like protein|tara:strand:- start:134 stop:379 length:246 start_codon:yes stop_codon:yes gene_type:complete
MADTTVTISDGSVSKVMTIPDATWNLIVANHVRNGHTLADVSAEFVLQINKWRKELQNQANKETQLAAAASASTVSITAVS